MSKIKKGETAPLNVTKEARHRVFVGLGWDPNENFGIIDEAKALMGGKPVHHDLDLSCYIYDSSKGFMECVSTETDHHIDKSGQIYHSGDNEEGIGDGDDEQISVELKDLPPGIHYIVFIATVKSGHVFGEVDSPEIRLADGYSDHDFLKTPLSPEEGREKSAFVFARITRTGDDEWSTHNISEYTDIAENWAEFLKQYLN